MKGGIHNEPNQTRNYEDKLFEGITHRVMLEQGRQHVQHPLSETVEIPAIEGRLE